MTNRTILLCLSLFAAAGFATLCGEAAGCDTSLAVATGGAAETDHVGRMSLDARAPVGERD